MTDYSKTFFQSEKKFVVGKAYETLRVKSLPYGTYKCTLETCDEIGTIIPNSQKFLGNYVSSQKYGYGDNGGRYDYFKNINGENVTHSLDYDGTTRYRVVNTFIDERLPYLKLVESVGESINVEGKNEHINKYLLNELIVKEISSFMNPDLPPVPHNI
jgi:hypothetical protein